MFEGQLGFESVKLIAIHSVFKYIQTQLYIKPDLAVKNIIIAQKS